MNEDIIKNLTTSVGIIALLPFLIISSVGLLTLSITDKKNKKIIISTILISISLITYIIFNYLGGLYGIFTGDITKIENNRNLIILLSKLEIASLTISIMLFSTISLILIPNLISKLKTFTFFLIGILILYLDLFTDKFFLNDTLKYRINKYMGMEGPLFDIFVIYFATVILSETLYILLLRRKIKSEYLDIYPPILYGFIIIIFFGLLEALELYGIISIYPYVPSLIGIGTSLFSLTVFLILTNKYISILKESKLSIKITENAKTKINENIQKIITTIDSSLNSLSDIKTKIEQILTIPKITESSINETKNSIDKVKNTLNQLKTEDLPLISSIISPLENNIQRITIDKNQIQELNRLQKEIEKDIKNIKNFLSKESPILEVLENINKAYPDEIITFIEDLQNFYENTKVQLVNILILSEKQSNSEFATILAKEMLEKLEKIKDNLSEINTIKDKLKETKKNINTIYNQTIEKFTKILSAIKSHSYDDKTQDTDSLIKTVSSIEKTISKIHSQKDSIVSLIKSLENRIKEIENHSIEIYSLIQDTQDIYTHTNSIIKTAKDIKENITNIEKSLKNFKNKLTG